MGFSSTCFTSQQLVGAYPALQVRMFRHSTLLTILGPWDVLPVLWITTIVKDHCPREIDPHASSR